MLLHNTAVRTSQRGLRCRCLSRRLSSEQGEDHYLENWQRKQVKPHAFYDEQAKRRHYFYTVDLQGRLFLEESRIKNITSCLKDNRFLDFFFSRVRPNDTGFHPAYPFISPCGKELNFILPADMPIVFHDMVTTEDTTQLIFGGTKKVDFDPYGLYMSPSTHRLYHKLDVKPSSNGSGMRVGLLRSHVALALSEHIHVREDERLEFDSGTDGHVPIAWLPQEEEPVWGMPVTSEDPE